MNKTQRENLAKFSYDIAKLIFAAFVLANFMSEKFSILLAVFGTCIVAGTVILGYNLNKKE
jgi:hypothetical protein